MDIRYNVLHRAVSELARRCDGAESQDGVGFNGHDTKFGRRVAAMPPETWDNDIAAEVARILPVYREQLKSYGVYDDELLTVIASFKNNPDNRTEARDKARQAEYARKHEPYVTIEGNLVKVWNSYSIRAELSPNGFNFGRNGTKTWDAPLNGLTAATIIRLGIILTDDQQAVLNAHELDLAASGQTEELAHIDVCSDHPQFLKKGFEGDHLTLRVNYGQIPLTVTRALPGREWDRLNRVDHISPHIGLFALAEQYKLTISGRAREMIEAHREEQEVEIAARKAQMADSFATETDMVVPLRDDLYPFQQAGVAYGLKHMEPGKGVMIGDEMGLGKTRQALSLIESKQAYPCLVVCPPKLTHNWRREIKALLPHRTVAVLSGKGNGCFLDEADIYVIGYSVLDTYLEILPNLAGFVLDESHYVKNEKAGRTKTALTITGHGYIEEKIQGRKVRHPLPGKMVKDAVIVELTGTSVLNRPAELVQQLVVLGWLDPTKWTIDEGTVKWFLYRFCGPEKGYMGHMTFKGATNLEELHAWLRMNCYVRREKMDVLKELPPKTRAPLFIDMDNRSRALYEKLADEGAEKAAKSSAEALVYMNALRHAVGTAKKDIAAEWALDFLESTDKSLIIFANHKDVQKGIIDGLQAQGYEVLSILGGQSTNAIEAEKARFQAKEARVIVLSLMGAKEGHTLTAASDVLMVEQGWNPGTQDQAEDRAHRIGQDVPVTIWYLIAQDTFDEDLYEIVEGKRKIVKVVNAGITVEMDEASVFSEVLDRTLAKHGGKRTFTTINIPKEETETQFRGCDECGNITDCTQHGEGVWICDECTPKEEGS